MQALKALPDAERRQYVADADAFSKHVGEDGARTRPSCGAGELDAWLNAGMELGNHTWDHPCLDMCAADEQRRQIVEADRWLERIGAFESRPPVRLPQRRLDAGQRAGSRGARLRRCAVVRPSACRRRRCEPLRMSRVRLDTGASVERARAILSGGHSMLYRPPSPTVVASGAA